MTSTVKHFNPVTTEIEHGLTLIEAGAGTGKTYSLVRVILRELVEKSLDPSEIVTVTFTRAATAEIKSRLHELISEVLGELKLPADKVENDLVKNWLATQDEAWLLDAKRKLSIALSAFDSIPIFTIDGFFQRLLKEYAFESNVLFSSDLEPDESPFIHMALQDYWRQHVYQLRGSELHQFLQEVNFDKAKHFLKEALRSSETQLDPAYLESIETLSAAYHEAWKKFVELLQKHHEAILAFIENPTPGLKKAGPFHASVKSKAINEIYNILENPHSPINQPLKLDHFRSSHILTEAAFNKNKYTDLSGLEFSPIFDAIEALVKTRPNDLQSAYLGGIYQFVKTRLKELKADQKVQCYNDITSTLSNILKSDSNSARAIKQSVYYRYKAALIDEFQDTSPEQCNVFTSLFKQEKREESDERFFHIIGDPKQSIYRFRGADVFSYLKVAKNVDHHYSLLTNYRSSPSMIHAVNTLFTATDNPFLIEQGIDFQPSRWNGQAEDQAVPSPSIPALFFQSIDGEEKISAPEKLSIYYHDICKNIIELLDQPWSEIDPEADMKGNLQPADFAILVRKKSHGQEIADLLSSHGIPATLNTNTSLLASEEASDVLAMLHALLEPRRSTLLRAALLHPSLGSGEHLQNDLAFDAIANDFSELHTIWMDRGLMPAMQQCVETFSIRTRLLKLTHGQRRLTNFMHLIELLDNKARSEKFTPAATVQWLEMATQGIIIDADAEQLELRIATDDAAVQILTQHTSKGLEYPIVFTLPTSTGIPSIDKLSHSYHAPESGEPLFAAYQDKESDSYPIRVLEEQADSVRLTYVALTRAKSRCYFYYDPPKPNATSKHAICLMLGERDQDALLALVDGSHQTIQYAELGMDSMETELTVWQSSENKEVAALTTRNIENVEFSSGQRTTSFSGITRNAHDIFHDLDSAVTPEAETSDKPFNQEAFWGELQAGASLGLVFHEVLEELNFQDTTELTPLIVQKLEKYSPWTSRPEEKELSEIIDAITANIEQLLKHELSPDIPSTKELRLNSLSNSQRLNEAQFLLSGENFTLPSLTSVFGSAPPNTLPQGYIETLNDLPRSLTQGFLDGIIDLIFEHEGRYHILDWKTNSLTDNSTAALSDIMAEHHYYLQYHLYSLALDQLLTQRLGASYDPEKHLGSCFYVFLRGVDPAVPGSGVFSDTICTTRLNALRQTYLATSAD